MTSNVAVFRARTSTIRPTTPANTKHSAEESDDQAVADQSVAPWIGAPWIGAPWIGAPGSAPVSAAVAPESSSQ